MKKIISILIFIVFSQMNAQTASSNKWKDLFSYNNVFAIKEDAGKMIAVTKSGLFYYNTNSGEITKLSKANGLHEVNISAFDYNEETKIGLIGYESGALDVITPEKISYIVDIPIAQGFSGNKKINHIFIDGNRAIVSVNYGVSIFKLSEKEFGETAFFSTNGNFTPANEAVIQNDKAFVATTDGLKTHLLDVSFPVFSSWTTVVNDSITNIDRGEKIVYTTNTNAFYQTGTSFTPITENFNMIKDVVVADNKIIITAEDKVATYTDSGASVNNQPLNEICNTANLIDNKLYIGTQLNGVKNASNNYIKPDGPYNNIAYKMSLSGNKIWVSTGGRINYNTPIYRDLGYYYYDGEKWIYPDYFIDNPIVFNVLDVLVNPSNPSEVFFTNYSFVQGQKGIYKMVDNEFVKVYKNEDSSKYYNRPVGLVYDENNILYSTANVIQNSPLPTGYYWYDQAIDDFKLVPFTSAKDAQKPFINNNIFYLPCPKAGGGGMVMKEMGHPNNANTNTKVLKTENNLPINGVVAAALDKDDVLWIGTRLGLRTLSNPESAITSISPQTEPIIIEQNGIAEELFRDSSILQIAVDGGNKKWISVEDGGVYYLSETGEKTLAHFTKENSPLPDNNVTDIQVDEKTGKVYFATLNGIMVYQSDISNVGDKFGEVVVYPNPVVKKQNHNKVTLKGLASKTNIRIVNTAGNLVHQGVAKGGVYEWNLHNLRGQRVASGIYFVLMTNKDGSDTKTTKIAVVN
ncbi:MAG: hypothetical protein CSA38_05300 [Flavobacteriales bacterium]|nr:MAG: hypothetical protein CSA38_05300 [Flavobacteriales bacterium]